MEDASFDTTICRQCRGRCCQGHSGVWSDPQRFFALFNAGEIPTAKQLATLLRQQQLTLRDLGGVLIPAPLTLQSGCIFQGESGCALPLQTRPCQCLALQPHLDTLLDDQIHCSLPPAYGSGTARINWRPLQDLLTAEFPIINRQK